MATFKVKQNQILDYDGKKYLSGDSIELSDEEVKKVGDVLEPAEGSTSHHASATDLHVAVADKPADAQTTREEPKKDKSGIFGFGKGK